MKKFYTLLLVFFVFLSAASAQNTIVKGRVVDEGGSPLVGVTVLVKEQTKVGTITNENGEFSIKLPAQGKTLLISYVGMESQAITIDKGTLFINVKMIGDQTQIDQVVVTGYNQTTFKKMTGSVGVVTADKLANQPQASVDALLQGQVAGVAVSAIDGQPGRAQKVTIRGTSTISGFNEPLWVVDGVPMQNNAPGIPSTDEISSASFDNLFMTGVAGINPNDIENITILKDASAAAIYGSRASGGVIVITTKKGKAGAMKVNYSTNVTVTTSPQSDANLMDAGQKIAYEKGIWDEFSAEKYAAGEGFPIIGIVGMVRSGMLDYEGWTTEQQDEYLADLSDNSTDWYDELFRNAVSTNHHISMNGGNENLTYYTSLGYTRDAGMLKNNNSDRYNITSNFTITPNEFVKVDLGTTISYMNSVAPYTAEVDPFKYAYFANPYEVPYNEDGSYRTDETYYSLGIYNDDDYPDIPKSGFNVLRELDETSSNNKRVEATVRAGVDLKLHKNLKFVGLGSYSYANNKTKDLLGENTLSAFRSRMSVDDSNSREYGVINQTTADMDSYMVRGHFVYTNDFNESKHNLSVIAGAELRGSKSNGLYSKRYGYDPITQNTITPLPSYSNQLGYDDLQEYVEALDASSGQTTDEQRYASFYASADYYLTNKYVFNFSFRTDGSSNFGNDQQFNPNGAAGFAWNIAEEDFMYLLTPVMNRLTLRVAGGFTGNVNRSVYPQMVLSYWDDYRQLNDNIYHTGSVVSAPNPNLRWEKTFDFKTALDFGLFDNRLNGNIEAYYRNSSDVVVSASVLSTTGYTRQSYNMADIENRGLEVTLSGTPILKKDFSLFLSANFAYNMNKVTNYKSPYSSMSLGELWEGYPTDAIFSGKCQGIDPETGLYTFELRPDAVIEHATDLNKADNYRFFLGTPTAPYTGGASISANYKNFKLSVNSVFALGAKDFEYIQPTSSYSSASGDYVEGTQNFRNDLYGMHLNVDKSASDRWTETNTDGTYPRIWSVYGPQYNFGYYNPMSAEITRGAFLTNLSYLRIKSIIFGYSCPKQWLSNAKISNIDLSLSLNNFFTFTKYKGMDPETPGAAYPISRSVTFAINLGF